MSKVVAAGTHLAYLKEGAGTPVLLLQGVGLIGEGWRPQIEHLRANFTCIAPDNRGIGDSPAGKDKLSVEAMADDAIAVMDAEGFNQFHVVGHSMGGLLAQEVALRVPGRVLSLSLLCTFARGKQGATLSAGMMVTALRTRIGTRRMRRHAFLSLVLSPKTFASADKDAWAEQLAPLFGHDLADQPPIVLKQVGAMSRHNSYDKLGQLGHIPTLVASAEHDGIARVTYGIQLAAAIPGATFVELPGAGHGVPIEDAPKINALLQEQFRKSNRTPIG
jgi:pimeloyl-ACP methyl ester carboxylesterase